MGLLNKLRPGHDRQVGPPGVGRPGTGMTVPAQRPGPSFAPRGSRPSNGLKDCLWHLEGIDHGNLLDLGPVWQATVSFFVERNFKVYTEDLLLAWKGFLHAEEERLRALPEEEAVGVSPAARAEDFLRSSLQYPGETFDAVLLWDLLDYLDSDLVARLVARLAELLRDGGVVLALFHSRKPEAFHRYRVLDAQNIELIPGPGMFLAQRVFQNREILNLFSRFRTSKTFVGRDQLREGLFVK
jgi:SAM-dependent methyltransferase